MENNIPPTLNGFPVIITEKITSNKIKAMLNCEYILGEPILLIDSGLFETEENEPQPDIIIETKP
jgi:hypothetical protein